MSRSREELADATAVELTRNPSGIRMALEKLDRDVTVVRKTSHATSHLWIESPDDHVKGHKGSASMTCSILTLRSLSELTCFERWKVSPPIKVDESARVLTIITAREEMCLYWMVK